MEMQGGSCDGADTVSAIGQLINDVLGLYFGSDAPLSLFGIVGLCFGVCGLLREKVTFQGSHFRDAHGARTKRTVLPPPKKSHISGRCEGT